MALNEVGNGPARVTRYSVAYLIAQDGQAGTTLTLRNSDLLGALDAYDLGGPLHELLSEDEAANSQAIQRAKLLGDASGLAANLRDYSLKAHCKVEVLAETVAGWSVDADVDAVSVGRGELNIIGPAGVGRALITIRFVHSYER